MRIFFLLAILILIGGSFVASKILHDAGYVLLSYDTWTIETSLWIAAVVQIIALVLFYIAARLVLGVAKSPNTVRRWVQDSRLRRTNRNLVKGFHEYAGGRWKQAQKLMVNSAKDSEAPMINYLIAAWSADRRGDLKSRERLLEKASEKSDDDGLSVGLTEARISMERGDWAAAAERLEGLRAKAPEHAYLMQLQKQVLVNSGDWKGLSYLIGDLRRAKTETPSSLFELEKKVYAAVLAAPEDPSESDLTAQDRLRNINETWSTLGVSLRSEESVILPYVTHLIELGAEPRAEVVLRNALKRRWSDALVRQYGLVEGEDPRKQLSVAEGWLRERPDDAMLLLACGRLSLRNQLWGKARSYFESSINLAESPEAYAELGRLLAFLGEHAASSECFRNGLERRAGSLIALSLPEAEPAADETAEAASSVG